MQVFYIRMLVSLPHALAPIALLTGVNKMTLLNQNFDTILKCKSAILGCIHERTTCNDKSSSFGGIAQ